MTLFTSRIYKPHDSNMQFIDLLEYLKYYLATNIAIKIVFTSPVTSCC